MAKFYTELNETLREFIAGQQMFFHATAPNQGRINLSPKGLDTFRVLSDKQVAYLNQKKKRPKWTHQRFCGRVGVANRTNRPQLRSYAIT